MNLEKLREICAALPGTTEDVKWGADLCFCVGEKMYAVTGVEGGGGMSLKATPEDFERLIGLDGIEPSPYLARYGWIRLHESHGLADDEVADLIRTSHRLVAAKLPAKVRKALGVPSR
jgi:predicted DNA-binding protein (MmcQ/YjbR family)